MPQVGPNPAEAAAMLRVMLRWPARNDGRPLGEGPPPGGRRREPQAKLATVTHEDYAKPRHLATEVQVSDLQGRGFA